MADVLEVEKRAQTGSAASQRLRRSGRVPAILYGHGQANENLAVPLSDVKALLRHHGKMVELKGAVKETALVSSIQWDPMGIEVLHMDLIRVNLGEKVQVTVAIQAYGDPVGLREGGILLENMHDVEISCPAGSIPDALRINIADLHVGQHLTAADLELPDGIELITSEDAIVTHIEAPKTSSEDEEAEDGSEPEVISKGAPKEEED